MYTEQIRCIQNVVNYANYLLINLSNPVTRSIRKIYCITNFIDVKPSRTSNASCVSFVFCGIDYIAFIFSITAVSHV